MKTALLKTARHPGHDKNNLKLNRTVITFIVCLLISGFLWVMNSLSKKYTDTLTFHIRYQHLPTEKKVVPFSDAVSIKLTTTGYRLLTYKLGIKEMLINVDANAFRHKDNQYIYNLQNQFHQDKIREQLGEQTDLMEISPDTLFLRPASSQP